MKKIKVSVIIPSYNSSQTIERCLTSLEQQETSEKFEVIVVDSSTDNTKVIIEAKFPHVNLYCFSDRKYAGVARNFGVSKSSGDIIVFTDADCFVESNWINQIIAAHQKTDMPVIGGSIANGNPESYIGWAYYFSSFNRFLPRPGVYKYTDLATGCLTIKKWIFEKYGYFSEDKFAEDTLFCWQMAEAGYPLLFMPDIKVYHINLENWQEFILKKIQHGKAFAQVRVRKYNFSTGKHLVYILGSPLLPLLLIYRCTKEVLKAPIYWKYFSQVLPLICLGLLAWSWGEFLGYFKKNQSLLK
ncbi:glycosyltransferase [Nodularia sphaerocarpa]|uniref:glycosyltransferase n=1 Tax=Nodularia sphaerocarpa TaxID=137816 RepID=UPI001EFB22F6|nr:glycosyltransferase [Nodularia sphaerocarpa]MDB9372525.1 glycosyltransferase [Nodularia sphaerocarpa CS-585]MDB9376925.1 glycosyltransferase [Nodularia sphaerocarpa CS-585A2]ULP73656.1 Validoxylamine A glucosyltransferase [Nodularia sphaerocarpa UHCC 0038]